MEPAALARAEEPQVDRRGEPERQTVLVDLERGRAVQSTTGSLCVVCAGSHGRIVSRQARFFER